MRGFRPNVDVTSPQVDEIKSHFQKNQFVYGVLTGMVIATFLSRSTMLNQTIRVVVPREIY